MGGATSWTIHGVSHYTVMGRRNYGLIVMYKASRFSMAASQYLGEYWPKTNMVCPHVHCECQNWLSESHYHNKSEAVFFKLSSDWWYNTKCNAKSNNNPLFLDTNITPI